MAQVPELLLNTLLQLVDKDLRTFQWYLYMDVLEGFAYIPRADLDGVDRPGTVSRLVETYGYDDAVTVSVEVLTKMKLKLWAETLKKKRDEGKEKSSENQSTLQLL